jgi:hypothetical protein
MLEGEAKHFEGAMLWKVPLLPQYSANSSVMFERNYKLVIK